MKTSSIAVETSRSTTQSDSIVRQTNKRSSYLSYTTMNNKHIFNDTAQLLFNMKRITSTEKAKSRVQEREPPLPLYIGLVREVKRWSIKCINSVCASRTIVWMMLSMVSVATSLCNKFKETGVVCLLSMNHGFFTVGAIDRIDQNPSSTTAKSSLHGTGISLF